MSNKSKFAAALLTLSVSGIALITGFEGKENVAYYDSIKVPTVCVGHTGPEVKVGDRYSDTMCDDLLRKDTTVAQKAVKRLVKAKITQEQYDVLVSWTFNLGEGNLAASTMLKDINAGNCVKAGAEMRKWDRAGGQVVSGLTRRRVAESLIWLDGC